MGRLSDLTTNTWHCTPNPPGENLDSRYLSVMYYQKRLTHKDCMRVTFFTRGDWLHCVAHTSC